MTANPLERDEVDIAQPVTTLKENALRRKRAATIGDTLSAELGVQSSYFGPGAGRPIIRGLDGPRVRVMENGIGTLDVSTISPDHLVTTDSLYASQIEILRGPATLLYGGGAIGGLVNVVTNRIPRALLPEPNGTVELRADSATGERTASAELNGGGDNLVWHLDALRRKTADYKIPGRAFSREEHAGGPNGKVPNSAIDSEGGSAGASWIGARGYLGASAQTLKSNYGIPGEEGVRIDLKQDRLDTAGELERPFAGLQRIKFKFGSNDYEHRELEPSGEVGTVFKNKAHELRIETTHAPIAGWEGVLGVQHLDRDFSAIGEESIIPFTTTRATGIFLVEERRFGAFSLSLGARSETETHRPQGDNPTRRFKPTTFSTGVVWNLAEGYGASIYVTRAERAPSIEELYSHGAHPATLSFEVGNAALTKERSQNIDVTLRKSTGQLKWKINLFHNRFSNYVFGGFQDIDGDGIADRVTDEGELNPEGEFTVLNFTQSDARFTGIEAEMTVKLDERFGVRVFTDRTQGKLTGGGNLPRIAPGRVGGELDFSSGRWSAQLTAMRVQRQGRVAALETVTSGYTRLDAEMAYNLGSNAKPVLLFAQGKNLLNEEARLHTSFLKDFAPLPGRSLTLGVRAKF